jgi:hypothetical protein
MESICIQVGLLLQSLFQIIKLLEKAFSRLPSAGNNGLAIVFYRLCQNRSEMWVLAMAIIGAGTARRLKMNSLLPILLVTSFPLGRHCPGSPHNVIWLT